MSGMTPAVSSPPVEVNILDRIAESLPLEIRAAYYRELNYCRSLPENDELLRVLRAMQFLALLIHQAPDRVVTEREKLERLFTSALEKLMTVVQGSEAQGRELDRRLAALPAEVALGLQPEAIAREINESLRQQFVQSTIPQTALALTATAGQLKHSVAEFGKTAGALGDSYRGAAEDARKAIAEIESAVAHSAATARRAATELSSVFQKEYRWSIYTLLSIALVVGMAVGALIYQYWLDSPPTAPSTTETPLAQPAPKAKARTMH